MKPKHRLSILLLMIGSAAFQAQSNTASLSGSIGKCGVWSYPYTLYNSAAASQTVNNGITVTVDQDRNIGAVNFTGSGAMSMSGANGITLSGTGSEINCRWDISNGASYTVINNDGASGTNSMGDPVPGFDLVSFFTAPYAGIYRWVKGSGWSAGMSGSFLSGGFGVRKAGTDYYDPVYYENEANPAGTCGNPPGVQSGPVWTSARTVTLNAAQGLSYSASTMYRSSGTCSSSMLKFTVGSSTVLYEN